MMAEIISPRPENCTELTKAFQAASELSITPITPDNAHALLPLLGGLAQHHGTRWKGNIPDLFQALFHPAGYLSGFYVQRANIPHPVGYALVTPMHTQEGSGLCLQDLYVSPEQRASSGVGSYAISHLLNMARQRNLDFIEFSVLRNNTQATFNFYERKCRARTVPKADYDLSHYLQDQLPETRNPYRDRFYPRVIESAADFDRLFDMIDKETRDNIFNPRMKRGLRDAAQSSSSELIAAITKGHKVVGMTVSNINFYSDSASLGYDLQPPVFMVKNARKRRIIFHDILKYVQQRSLLTNWKGQLVCAINTQDEWQSGLMKDLSAGRANMVLQDGSTTDWLTYTIPKEIIQTHEHRP